MTDKTSRSRRSPDASDAYTAADIEVLEGLEPVRRRPGMYIGGTDEKALHHLFAEVIDNSMDEAVAGHATLHRGRASAGRLPDRHRQRPRHPGRPASEVQEQVGARSHHDDAALGRQVRRQGLRDLRRPARRRRLGGQRAVRTLEVEVARGQQLYRQALLARQAAGQAGEARPGARTGAAPRSRFQPDPQIFGKGAQFEPARLYRMARSKAYLFGGVEIRWTCDPSLITGRDAGRGGVPLPRRPQGLSASDDRRAQSQVTTRDLRRPASTRPGRPRLGRMGGRLDRRRATASSTPTATPSRRPKAARTRPASAPR